MAAAVETTVGATVTSTTDDAALNGRLRLRQPARGHRFGHDAILLAAATHAKSGEHAVEFGAGVGAAGLALALRIAGLRVTLVEIEPALVALAQDNAARNGLDDRVRAVAADVTGHSAILQSAGVSAESADLVLMNPPFNDPSRQPASPDAGRRRAHAAGGQTLSTWVGAAERLLAPRGALTLIWRADGLAAVLDALDDRFGAIVVRPVHPRADAPAIRILVRAVKRGRALLALLPGLVLNDERGRPTMAAEAILRDGATLAMSE
jgi:tRNA1(Val) A37 N6-methylase TrmN6